MRRASICFLFNLEWFLCKKEYFAIWARWRQDDFQMRKLSTKVPESKQYNSFLFSFSVKAKPLFIAVIFWINTSKMLQSEEKMKNRRPFVLLIRFLAQKKCSLLSDLQFYNRRFEAAWNMRRSQRQFEHLHVNKRINLSGGLWCLVCSELQISFFWKPKFKDFLASSQKIGRHFLKVSFCLNLQFFKQNVKRNLIQTLSR